jgi:pimeloyl-ACP methyl ester carboxylesterase
MGYSFSWRFAMPALAPHAEVFALDLLGAGFSDRPESADYGLQAAADRLVQLLRALGTAEFDLLGTSHGGAVAMMVAAAVGREPGPKIRRLILCAPVNPWSRHGQRLAPIVGSALGTKVFMSAIARQPWTHKLVLARLYGNPRSIPEGTLEGYAAPSRHPNYFRYGLAIARRWNEDLRELTAVLPEIAAIPTFLMWGRRDRAVTWRSAEPLSHCFEKCEVKIFPKAGHLPYEETPEEFNASLRDYLLAEL